MAALNRSLAEITPEHIERLVSDRWTENETLEFKETLAHSGSGKEDPWLTDQSAIGTGAKRDVLAEVVAMANSYGGDVILGIQEADEKPPQAVKVRPIPKCIDLASRLEHAARDLIHPQIPMLGVRGIETQGTSGVVVFRVPRSRSAPHRLEIKGIEKECYKRVSDRTECMTMREIQDLTFSVANGIERVLSKLSAMENEFIEWTKGAEHNRRMAYAVIAAPMSSDLYLDRVHGNSAVTPTSLNFTVKPSLHAQSQEFTIIQEAYNWRPVLRGTEAVLNDAYANLKRLTCEGDLVDFHRITVEPTDPPGRPSMFSFFPGWVFGAVLNCMESAGRFRVATAGHAVQYAISIIISANARLPVSSLGNSYFQSVASFPEGITRFPHYQLGERDSWTDTFRLIWRDFFSAVGIDAQNDDPKVAGW